MPCLCCIDSTNCDCDCHYHQTIDEALNDILMRLFIFGKQIGGSTQTGVIESIDIVEANEKIKDLFNRENERIVKGNKFRK